MDFEANEDDYIIFQRTFFIVAENLDFVFLVSFETMNPMEFFPFAVAAGAAASGVAGVADVADVVVAAAALDLAMQMLAAYQTNEKHLLNFL